jgi:ABC-type transport system involved in multi-copper enzyme maturation permease subunit
MVWTLVSKELRETRGFAALAVAFYAAYISRLTGMWSRVLSTLLGWIPGLSGEPPVVPFLLQDPFVPILFTVGGILAIALGLRQSAWEPSQGTALYLFSLPMPRRSIVAIKIATGIGLLAACTLLPVVTYAIWAATPGTHASPFEWSMTETAFRVWLILPLFYLGAFASGIRDARWFGSRLLPLAAVVIPSILLYTLPFWWLLAFPLYLLSFTVLVSDAFLEAETRDY